MTTEVANLSIYAAAGTEDTLQKFANLSAYTAVATEGLGQRVNNLSMYLAVCKIPIVPARPPIVNVIESKI